MGKIAQKIEELCNAFEEEFGINVDIKINIHSNRIKNSHLRDYRAAKQVALAIGVQTRQIIDEDVSLDEKTHWIKVGSIFDAATISIFTNMRGDNL